MSKDKQKRQCNYVTSSKTLDLRHQTQLESFQKNKELMNGFNEELIILDNQYDAINRKRKKEVSDDELLEIIRINDKRTDLNNKILSISSNVEEINYYINTGDVLFEYYSLLDNSNVGAQNVSTNKKSQTTLPIQSKKKSVIDFFNTTNDNSVKQADIIVNENNRAHLLDKYLSFTDTNYINNSIITNSTIICNFCLQETLFYCSNESIYCCENCSTVEKVITDNEKPSYKDPPKEISYFSYKRINHYTEWLNQIQGKETTDIPDDVFENIVKELQIQRIYDSDYKTITRIKIKEILKKLKINKYYEHVPYILNRITGNPNPHLSPELEDKLKQMFKEIQVPFLKYSPLIRKNFLSYSYVIHKFIVLLNQTEYLQYFPLLKSREKLHQQEQIWKKICEDLGWEFIRSI
jgi:hypothetical protein